MSTGIKRNLWTLFLITSLISCSNDELSVKDVIRNKIKYLYQNADSAELMSLSYEMALSLFTGDEKEILATRHWMFDVNVPVVVSVMRSTKQKIVPFWLAGKGFEKTGMTMKNENTTYEVWQKKFKAGRVGLGINGLENYSLHYFVSVAPVKNSDQLIISNFYPLNQFVGTLADGSFTYHDWDELVLTDVPSAMKGQKLLTTVRGRGTESHLVGAFRSTKYPSSENPDQVMVTWSSDPASTIDVQWRSDSTVHFGSVQFRESGSDSTRTVVASIFRMEDMLLMNDPFISRFTAHLNDLKPGTKYEYRVGIQNNWPAGQAFTTASHDNGFTFIWYGDTHHSPEFGKLINAAESRHPETAFYSIAGDIVSDGLHREQWDDIFYFTREVVCKKPLMTVPGNHDNRAGLGAMMFRELFSYPANGPDGVEKEQTYSFEYKNALFLMIDATSPVDAQTAWIKEKLAGSYARWKFVMLHFPPYSSDGGYPEIREKWGALFDRYHVDLVMSGHVHNYMRTKPMYEGKVVSSASGGPIYLVSIGIPDNDPQEKLTFADAQVSGEMLYQKIAIDGNKLDYKAMNIDGVVRDKMVIIK
jgi:predicted phosphodiesterase